MIKKLSFLIFVVLFSSFSSSAQLRAKFGKNKDKPAFNSAYAELLGSGFQWSVNYERDLGDVLVRVGFGYATQDFLVPVVLSYSLEIDPTMFFEFGGGVLNKIVESRLEGISEQEIPNYEVFPTLNFALRFQPHIRGYFIKTAFTPIFDLQKGNESYFFGQEKPALPMFLWGGASLGIVF